MVSPPPPQNGSLESREDSGAGKKKLFSADSAHFGRFSRGTPLVSGLSQHHAGIRREVQTPPTSPHISVIPRCGHHGGIVRTERGRGQIDSGSRNCFKLPPKPPVCRHPLLKPPPGKARWPSWQAAPFPQERPLRLAERRHRDLPEEGPRGFLF